MPRVTVKGAKGGRGKVGGEARRAGGGQLTPCEVTRAIVRKLKLKSQKEWWAWSNSGQRPSNIPSHPDQVYRDDAWWYYMVMGEGVPHINRGREGATA
jgi:hypothetical protein